MIKYEYPSPAMTSIFLSVWLWVLVALTTIYWQCPSGYINYDWLSTTFWLWLTTNRHWLAASTPGLNYGLSSMRTNYKWHWLTFNRVLPTSTPLSCLSELSGNDWLGMIFIQAQWQQAISDHRLFTMINYLAQTRAICPEYIFDECSHYEYSFPRVWLLSDTEE